MLTGKTSGTMMQTPEIMTQKEKIDALRKGKTGAQILRILDNLHGVKITTISTTTEAIPDPGYIITWDGRQVAF